MVTIAEWEQVLADGCPAPPASERLDVATALVSAFTDPDARLREIVAPSIFSAWVGQGSFDDLLPGLGDGLLAGLRPIRVSAASADADSARDLALHGRCGRAGALSVVVARDNSVDVVGSNRVLDWADRAVSWLLSERDVRPVTPLGVADAIARGSELVATLAASPTLGADELLVLLDVVAERAASPADAPLTPLQADYLAFAAVCVLSRDLVDAAASESWVDGLAEAASGVGPPAGVGTAPRAGALALLGALHTQLVLGVQGLTPTPPPSPRDRSDLVLAVQAALRSAAPWLYRGPG
jgi:hypothetical protein